MRMKNYVNFINKKNRKQEKYDKHNAYDIIEDANANVLKKFFFVLLHLLFNVLSWSVLSSLTRS